MTKSVTEQVAREKERMFLKLGHSADRAKREAQAVRDYDAKHRKGGK